MKVLLISLSNLIHTLGVPILSACLREKGHMTRIMFLPRFSEYPNRNKILDEMIEFSQDADLIGLSVMTNHFENAVEITRRIKQSLRAPVLWGGIHPTVRPQECLDHSDIISVGEGEKSLVELTEKMEKGDDFRHVPGMYFKHQGRLIANSLQPLVQDLDTLPFPDLDFRNQYIILTSGHIQQADAHSVEEHWFRDSSVKTYMIMPSRGCPFSCTYCCNNVLNQMYRGQKVIRKRSVDNVIEELLIAKSKLPFLKRITLADDGFLFAYTESEIEEFSRKYKERVRIPLRVTGITPKTIRREKVFPLVDAGMEVIRMGIQTGSESTRNIYARSESNDEIESAVRLIHELGDRVKHRTYDIIVDNPWETERDVIKTLIFLSRLPVPYELAMFSLTFYPGTELYRRAKRECILSDELKEIYRKNFYSIRNTYLNKLFLLLHNSARRGRKISPRMMFFLTNRGMRRIYVSHVLYRMLKLRISFWSFWEGITRRGVEKSGEAPRKRSPCHTSFT